MDWQPIETAPRDGTSFLVWLPTPELGSNVQVWSRRTEKYSGTICGRFAFDFRAGPTHWMPLPEPPKND